MKMMGLPGWMHWLSWFLTAFIGCLITNFLVIFLLGVDFDQGAVFEYSDMGVVFFSLIWYSMALIAMNFALSTFFVNRKQSMNIVIGLFYPWLMHAANIALGAGLILHEVSFFLPYGFLGQTNTVYNSFSFGSKMGFSLLPNIGIWLCLKAALRRESETIGIHFGMMNEPLVPGDTMTLG